MLCHPALQPAQLLGRLHVCHNRLLLPLATFSVLVMKACQHEMFVDLRFLYIESYRLIFEYSYIAKAIRMLRSQHSSYLARVYLVASSTPWMQRALYERNLFANQVPSIPSCKDSTNCYIQFERHLRICAEAEVPRRMEFRC